jgi:hypothetical protein
MGAAVGWSGDGEGAACHRLGCGPPLGGGAQLHAPPDACLRPESIPRARRCHYLNPASVYGLGLKRILAAIHCILRVPVPPNLHSLTS